MVAFVPVLHKTNFENLTVEHFRTALESVIPKAYASARNYIAELVPFARTLS